MKKLAAILTRMILITVLAIAVVLLINAFSNKENGSDQDAQPTTGDVQTQTWTTIPAEDIQEEPETMSQEEQETLVDEYIRANISELSPEPEVLGGTFYVTNITFSDLWEGEVQYEDGHIALTADFIYSVDEATDTVQVELMNVRD